jgi:hypothetical protein
MTETANLSLPLLQAAQAQKHVTVNEALSRLDALVQLRLVSISDNDPPALPAEGAAFGVASGAVNAWEGHAGQIAIYWNGGWEFVTPLVGWRAYVENDTSMAVFDGTSWRLGAVAVSAAGAGTIARTIEFDHPVLAGSTNTTTPEIPHAMIVLGVTGRVIEALTGAGLTGWKLGIDGADDRYGSGHGLAVNTYVVGPTGSPQAYWGGVPLKLSAEGGNFEAGAVRLVIHGLILEPPAAV